MTRQQLWAAQTRQMPVLVSAGAGAGKTGVIVERVTGYLLEGRDITEFLLITYTRAAAGEMRERLLARLESELAANPGNAHLRSQAAASRGAFIGTLHAFCLELYHEFGAAFGLPQGLTTADDARVALMSRRALDKLMEEIYAGGYEELLAMGLDMRGDERVERLVTDAYEKMRVFPDADEWKRRCAEGFKRKNWEKALGVWVRKQTRLRARELRRTAGAITDEALKANYAEALMADAENALRLRRAAAFGWDKLREAIFATEHQSAGRRKGALNDAEKEAVQDTRKRWKDFTNKLGDIYAMSAEEAESYTKATVPAARQLLKAAKRYGRLYSQEKLSRRQMDFRDQEEFALRLLREERVAATVRNRYAEVLVDEYQDINRRQDEIVNLLTGGGRNAFYVGDLRQSIYRFQMAEPSIFKEKYEKLPLRGGTVINLSHNFRSCPAILNAVNCVFGKIMDKDSSEVGYARPLLAGVEGETGPDVEWLMTGGGPEDGFEASCAREAESVARRLRELTRGGEYRPEDCAVLLRAPRGKAAFYRDALKAEGLGAVCGDGARAAARQTMRAFLTVIDNPTQDMPLIAVLRSPVYAFTPSELASLRAVSPGSLYDCVRAHGGEKAGRFLADMAQWRFLAPEIPVWKLAARIDAQTGMRDMYADGESELARFGALIRSSNAPDLPSFLRWLEAGRESDEPPGAPPGAVRIMSVHAAKGLEFPLVVVADLGKRFNLTDSRARVLAHAEKGLGLTGTNGVSHFPTPPYHALSRQIEWETKAEELRLLYVAMTRAKRKLILSHAEKSPAARLGKAALRKAGFPPPSPQSGLCWADWPGVMLDSEERIARVHIVDAGARESEDAPAPPPRPAAPPRRALPPSPISALPSKMTYSEMKGRYRDAEALEDTRAGDGGDYDFPLPSLSDGDPGAAAAQRGTAMHACMQHIPFRAMTASQARAEIDALAKNGLITPAQAREADESAIAGFFASVPGRRALAAPELYRETKFSLLRRADTLLPREAAGVDDEILLQGVIDCFFRDGGGWAVLDFKDTRRADAEAHRRQLEIYAEAVEAMTGAREPEMWVYFFRAGKAVKLDRV